MKPVEIRELTFRVNDNVILEGIGLDVEEGEFVGLIGPNGGGKTTLLQIIIGTVRGWTGSVRVFGRDPRALGSDRHLIAYVPQGETGSADFPATARDVVTMGRVPLRGLVRRLSREDAAAALEALDAVGMSEHAERAVGDLSGGQRQRVMIARALAARPRLLILDEPTTGIDPAAEEGFFELLASLKERLALTIIMASHDLTTVSEHCSTVACINRTMHCHSAPTELDHEQLSRVFGAHLEILVHGDVPHRVVRRHDAPEEAPKDKDEEGGGPADRRWGDGRPEDGES
ncbi:MAG: metal ABC transporter ATP-binding protein [Planctomycetota bacterium]